MDCKQTDIQLDRHTSYPKGNKGFVFLTDVQNPNKKEPVR